MRDDIEALARINQDITDAENAGDLARLGALVAPRLAFQRRDGSVVDREAFLLAPRPGQRELRIASIQLYGDRAFVACVVTDAGQSTHNLRMFVRDDQGWKLLGWANAPV